MWIFSGRFEVCFSTFFLSFRLVSVTAASAACPGFSVWEGLRCVVVALPGLFSDLFFKHLFDHVPFETKTKTYDSLKMFLRKFCYGTIGITHLSEHAVFAKTHNLQRIYANRLITLLYVRLVKIERKEMMRNRYNFTFCPRHRRERRTHLKQRHNNLFLV